MINLAEVLFPFSGELVLFFLDYCLLKGIFITCYLLPPFSPAVMRSGIGCLKNHLVRAKARGVWKAFFCGE